MNFYPLWPIPAVIVVAVLVVSLPRVSVLLPDTLDVHRSNMLDGLRGFLAIGVFAHHFSMMSEYQRSGRWMLPASDSYTLLGQLSVALFFMITGFLFWGKLVDSRGVPDWSRIYIGRVFRIGPMYLFVIVVMMGVVFASTGPTSKVSGGTLLGSIATWLCLGLLPGHPDINGYLNTRLLVAGVTWTLHFEWMFYLALIPLSLFARSKRHFAFTVLCYLICLVGAAFAPRAAFTFGALFAAGMLTASFARKYDPVCLQGFGASLLAILALVALFTRFHTGYGAPAIALATLFFIIVAGGNSLFGLLETSAARRLGSMSYSIYLLQGLAITATFLTPGVARYVLDNPVRYWLACLVTLVFLLLCSMATYVLVERRGIALGKSVEQMQFVRRVAQWLPKGRPA